MTTAQNQTPPYIEHNGEKLFGYQEGGSRFDAVKAIQDWADNCKQPGTRPDLVVQGAYKIGKRVTIEHALKEKGTVFPIPVVLPGSMEHEPEEDRQAILNALDQLILKYIEKRAATRWEGIKYVGKNLHEAILIEILYNKNKNVTAQPNPCLVEILLLIIQGNFFQGNFYPQRFCADDENVLKENLYQLYYLYIDILFSSLNFEKKKILLEIAKELEYKYVIVKVVNWNDQKTIKTGLTNIENVHLIFSRHPKPSQSTRQSSSMKTDEVSVTPQTPILVSALKKQEAEAMVNDGKLEKSSTLTTYSQEVGYHPFFLRRRISQGKPLDLDHLVDFVRKFFFSMGYTDAANCDHCGVGMVCMVPTGIRSYIQGKKDDCGYENVCKWFVDCNRSRYVGNP